VTHLDPPTGLGWLVYKTLHGGDAVSEETLAAGWRALSKARRAPYEAAGAAVDRASRRDERRAIVKMLRAEAGPGAELSESYGIVFLGSESPSYAGLCMVADMVEARNTEGVE
jgi:hypothetical protein